MAAAEPLPPPPPIPTPFRLKRSSILILAAGTVLVHILLDLILRLSPGASGLPGSRLLEIALIWVPLLLLGTTLGLSWGRPLDSTSKLLLIALALPVLGPSGLYALPLLVTYVVVVLFAWGRRTPWSIRLATIVAYGAILAGLGALALNAPAGARSCNLDPNQAHCLGAAYFDLLFRLAPLPAFFFLFANGRHRWTLGQCFGLSLALFTLWRGVYFSFPDLLVIAGGGAVLGPTPAIEFYRSFFLKMLWEVGYVLLGLFFIFQRLPGIHKPFTWGRELETLLRPLGAWTRRGLATDLAWGAVLFLAFAIGSSVLGQLLAASPTGSVGDDSRVFEEMTLDLVFLLAIAAGVGEEIVFRGFLQSGLERYLSFRGWPRLGAWILGVGALATALVSAALAFLIKQDATASSGFGRLTTLGVAVLLFLMIGALVGTVAMVIGWGGFGVAILLQGLLFGIVHAGYGDLDHLILPLMFGLLAGIVYRVFGLLPIILVHVEIDVFAFGYSYMAAGDRPWFGAFLAMLFVAQMAFAIIWLIMRGLHWFEGRRRVTPVLVRS